MSEILKRIKNFKIEPKRFDVIKEVYIRALKNFHAYDLSCEHWITMVNVYWNYHELVQLKRYTSWILSEKYWNHEDLLAIESELTVDSVQQFMARLWSNFHVEALIHGNVNRSEALEVIKHFESQFIDPKTTPVSQYMRNREIQLADGSNLYFETKNEIHKTNAIYVYIPIGVVETERDNCLLELFVQLINETFFDDLRTKQQLGYDVSAFYKRSRGVQGIGDLMTFESIRLTCKHLSGLTFRIQSDCSPEYLENRIEAFLDWTQEFLSSMSSETFESEKKSLITRKLESPKQLFQYSDRLWSEIQHQLYRFDRHEVDVKVIETLTKEDVIAFYEVYITLLYTRDIPVIWMLCLTETHLP